MMKMKICNVHFVMHADEYYNIIINIVQHKVTQAEITFNYN